LLRAVRIKSWFRTSSMQDRVILITMEAIATPSVTAGKKSCLTQAHGFSTLSKTVEGSCVNYENLDNYQTGIHDYFKFLKFGFSRASDIASLHVRRGRLSREDACTIVRLHDGKFPWRYLGKPIEDILKPLDIELEEFMNICDKFTNKKLFRTDSQGDLLKDTNGNLSKLKYADEDI